MIQHKGPNPEDLQPSYTKGEVPKSGWINPEKKPTTLKTHDPFANARKVTSSKDHVDVGNPIAMVETTTDDCFLQPPHT